MFKCNLKWLNSYLFISLFLNIKHCNEDWIQLKNKISLSLAGVSRLEHHPIHQKVAGLIPGWDTYLDCRLDPLSDWVQKATNWCFSHLPPSLPPTLTAMKKCSQVRIKKIFFSNQCIFFLLSVILTSLPSRLLRVTKLYHELY